MHGLDSDFGLEGAVPRRIGREVGLPEAEPGVNAVVERFGEKGNGEVDRVSKFWLEDFVLHSDKAVMLRFLVCLLLASV